MRDYKNIKAWQLADELTVKIYQISKSFPKEEMFAMVSQIRRAAYSVPSNITEGAGRRTQKDYLHFLDIAKGSLNETEYFLNLSKKLGYLSALQLKEAEELIIQTSKCIIGLIKYIENNNDEPAVFSL